MKTARRFWAIGKKDSGFFAPRGFAVFSPCAPFAQFFTGFLRPYVPSTSAVVTLSEMLFRGKPLKVVRVVVAFVTVLVVNVFGIQRIGNPARRNNPVHKPLSAYLKVSIASLSGAVWEQVSKNFPAARYGKKMVKHSIFETVHHEADHADLVFGN